MAITYDTRKIVQELVAILTASKDLEKVSSSAVIPLAQETAETAVYVGVVNVTSEIASTGLGLDSYDRNMTVSLYCNVDCKDDDNKIYDITDSIERTVLKDNDFWDTIINRDVVAVEYDAQEHFPKRSAVIILNIMFKLSCD